MTTQSPQRPARPRRCPICNKPVASGASRFCSERCSAVDLGRWLSGDYAIPVREEDQSSDDS
ncbi:DNA gyrase inhibitor YacG [Roseomonas sp. F4]